MELNAVPGSWMPKQLKRVGLRDARAYSGLGLTWPTGGGLSIFH